MITSKQNSLIKQIRSLADKKFRDRLNQYIVEGVKLVKEALALNLPVVAVVGTESALLNLCTKEVRVESVSQEVFDKLIKNGNSNVEDVLNDYGTKKSEDVSEELIGHNWTDEEKTLKKSLTFLRRTCYNQRGRSVFHERI